MNKKAAIRCKSNVTYSFVHFKIKYLIGSEDVNSDEVQDRILQTAGRASRRVVQQKIANDFADTKSDRDSSFTDDNEKQILAMENFNGLQEWNARADSMKELIKLSIDLEDPIEVVQKLRKEYRDYLTVPYVNVKHAKPETGSSTPFSALPKIVRVESNKHAANNEVSQQVSFIIFNFISEEHLKFSFHVRFFHLFNALFDFSFCEGLK
jgi:hypothetical protein